MPKIEMGKQYKSSAPDGLFAGSKFRRIIAIDCNGLYPVLVELDNGYLHKFTADGQCFFNEQSSYDLIEITPYSDFKRGDPIMVSNDGIKWIHRHFSQTNGYLGYTFCRHPTPEELAERGCDDQ